MEKVELIYDTDVYKAGAVITDVYFPESGIVSLLAVVGKNSTIEVGIVGDEGMVGLPVFLGTRTSINRTVVQGAGFALKMESDRFLSACESSPELQRVLHRFAYALMTQISQSAACNRFHPIDARLARWLMMTHDRMRSADFQITQEFLSNMLGVRREAVNKAATGFQEKELIRYSRGKLKILDADALEKIACSCYKVIAGEQIGASNS